MSPHSHGRDESMAGLLSVIPPHTPLHEYQKEEIEAARQEYDAVLNIPWIQRRKGILKRVLRY